MTEILNLTIRPPRPEEDAAAVYSEIDKKRSAADLDRWFNEMAGNSPAEAASDVPAQSGVAGPEDDPSALAGLAGGEAPASGGDPVDGGEDDAGWTAADVANAALAVGKDIGKGLAGTPKHVVGGVIDAIDNTAKALDSLIPLGGIQLTDPETGEFSLDWKSLDELGGDEIFNALSPAEPDTVTGGFIRSTAQFLTGFIPAVRMVKGAQLLKGVPLVSEMAAGAIADLVVFDPHEDRLSTFLNEIPALEAIVPDYLADNNPENESEWEGRMKNAIEGMGLGAGVELARSLFTAFKYYKAQRKLRAAEKDPVGAQAEAARDQIRDASRQELVADIPDEALAPLGDPSGPLLIEAKPDETLVQATSRMKEATARADASIANNDALGKINAVREKFAARAGATGRDPMDEMLDELRSGSVSAAKLPARPVSAIVRGLGGVDPASSFAGDLRSRGITPKSFPGLFRKGGNATLDNIPASEHPLFIERGADDGAGYIPQQSFIDGLEAELKGEPWRTAEQQARFDDVIGPIDEFDAQLSKLGIDYENMSNESVKKRLQEIADEEARFAAMDEVPPHPGEAVAGSPAGTLDDLTAELTADGIDIFASERNGMIRLSKIVVPENSRGSGVGTSAMQRLVDYADRTGQRVSLSPSSDFGGTKGRLVDFYKRLGFVENKGRNKDLSVSETMIREPDAAKLQAGEVKAPVAPLVDGTTPAPAGKIYINHARIQSADDVKAVLQQMADMDEAAIDAKRGGKVVTNAETIKASSQEYRDLNDLIGRDPGPMNAAQAVAARRLLVSSGEQIVQLAQKAQAPDATKADIFNFRRAMAVHYAIQSEVVAARTETARALQSWAIPAGATKARTQAITDLIAKGERVGDLQDIARAIATMGDNPTGLNTIARDLGRGKFTEALYQVWVNGLLSSPKTHMVNILSNSMTALYAIPERYVAAGFSKAFFNGEIQTGEAAAMAFGLMKSVRDGVRLVAADVAKQAASEVDQFPVGMVRNSRAAQSFKTGAEQYADRMAGEMGPVSDVFDAFVKSDQQHTNAISAEALGLKAEGGLGWGIDMLGKVVNGPGSALAAEDKLFKTIGYRAELNALAYRQAASEGLEGKAFAERVADILNNPPDSLKASAIDAAHYQTFTNNLGKVGQKGQDYLRNLPGGRWVVPFVRTPTNIMKYSFARTPLAYLSTNIRADIAAGGPRAAQAHARVALGTMVMMTIADMAAEGTITGGGPTDPNLRKLKQDSGWMPYSIKVGDRWYQYSRADPIAMQLGLAADIAEILSNADEEDAGKMVTAGVIALASNLANKTYMSGIFDFIGAFDPSNPSRDPAKYLQNFAGGLVPYSSFLRNAAGAMDPVARDNRTAVYGEDGKLDPVATYLDGMVNQIKKGIPGLSDELPPMRDLWGEDITKDSGIGVGWDFASPLASRADDPDPVSKVMLDNRISQSAAPRIINGVHLNGEEYAEFVREAGRPAKEHLDKLVSTPGFQRLSDGPDGMKAEVIKDIIGNYRDRARAVMMQRHPQLRERVFLKDMEKRKLLTGQ